MDTATNLYYFNQRYYDATIGRFINVDPVQDGQNWYVYCSNNPMSFVDPTGLWTFSIGISISGGAGGGGQAGAGISISFSKERGFQLGGYASAGSGAHAGAGGALNIDFSFSKNKNIKDTGGPSLEVGGSGGEGLGAGGSVNIPISKNTETKSIYTGSIQLTAKGPVPFEGHAYINGTAAGALIQIGGKEKDALINLGVDNNDNKDSNANSDNDNITSIIDSVDSRDSKTTDIENHKEVKKDSQQ